MVLHHQKQAKKAKDKAKRAEARGEMVPKKEENDEEEDPVKAVAKRWLVAALGTSIEVRALGNNNTRQHRFLFSSFAHFSMPLGVQTGMTTYSPFPVQRLLRTSSSATAKSMRLWSW